MTSYWWVDRTLPGIIGGLVVAAAIGVEHWLGRRYLRKLTDQQTAAIRRIHAGED